MASLEAGQEHCGLANTSMFRSDFGPGLAPQAWRVNFDCTICSSLRMTKMTAGRNAITMTAGLLDRMPLLMGPDATVTDVGRNATAGPNVGACAVRLLISRV